MLAVAPTVPAPASMGSAPRFRKSLLSRPRACEAAKPAVRSLRQKESRLADLAERALSITRRDLTLSQILSVRMRRELALPPEITDADSFRKAGTQSD